MIGDSYRLSVKKEFLEFEERRSSLFYADFFSGYFVFFFVV